MKIVIVKNLNLIENTTDPVKNEPVTDFPINFKMFIKIMMFDNYIRKPHNNIIY